MQAGGAIAGTVTAFSGGSPISGVTVCAGTGGDPPGPVEAPSYLRCANSNGSGEYTISKLPSRMYTVTFYGSEGVYENQHTENVEVTAPLTTGAIDAQMHLAGKIAGTVTAAAGGTPLEGIRVCAVNTLRCATTNAAGRYTISGFLAGSYRIEFRPGEEAGNYAPEYYDGKSAQIEAQEVSVSSGKTTSGVDAALDAGGQISGVVTSAASGLALGHVFVCASRLGGEPLQRCALTSPTGPAEEQPPRPVTPGPSPVASGRQPSSAFSQTRSPRLNARTGTLEFFFTVANAGTFAWALHFNNADVGFADALGVGPRALGAEARAAKSPAKRRKCRTGFARHHRHCVRLAVPFGSGFAHVAAGRVRIAVHAGTSALKALRAGRALHVSGTFRFQSALGGAPVSHRVSALVRQPARRRHRR
jgi:hypothetical protein